MIHKRVETGDVLANIAGVPDFEPLEAVSMDRFDDLVALNVKAPFRLTQGLLKSLEDGGASVINTSSFWARKMIADRSSSVYSMTRGAIESLTVALANELGESDVRVNSISPGTVRSKSFESEFYEPMDEAERVEHDEFVNRAYPLGRLGQPEEVASAALYLASPASAWVTGTVMIVDGGMGVR